MNFSFTPAQQKVHDVATALARERFAPRAGKFDQDAVLPVDNLADLREHDLLGLVIGRDLGGRGGGIGSDDPLSYLLALEQIATVCLSTSHCLQVHCHAARFIDHLGTPAQRRDILGDVVEHGVLLTTLGSEPGRTARGTRNESTGRPTSAGWRLDGTKNYATLAGASTYLLVLADTWLEDHAGPPLRAGVTPVDGERVALVTRTDAPGVIFKDLPWNPLGMRAAVSPTIRFENCLVPWSQAIGPSNAHLHGNWSVRADLGFAAQYVGAAAGLLASACDTVRRRGTAGDPYVQRHVGRVHFRIDGARTQYQHAAWLWTGNDPDAAARASIGAKHQAIEAANEVLDVVGQISGSSPFAGDSALERQYRDLRFLTMREHLDRAAAQVGSALLASTASTVPSTRPDEVLHGA